MWNIRSKFGNVKNTIGWVAVGIACTCGICIGLGTIMAKREDRELVSWRRQTDGQYLEAPVSRLNSSTTRRYLLLDIQGTHYKVYQAFIFANRPERHLTWNLANEGEMKSLGIGVFTMIAPMNTVDIQGNVIKEDSRVFQAKFWLNGLVDFDNFRAFKVMVVPETEEQVMAADDTMSQLAEGGRPYGYRP